MDWTPAKIAELARLAGEGLTSPVIAARMKITRGMVMGKLRREGIRLKGPPAVAPKKVKGGKRPPKVALLPQQDRLEARMGAGAAVLALRSNHCRWPIGDPSADDFHFCAEPCDPHEIPPYCREHGKRAAAQKKAA